MAITQRYLASLLFASIAMVAAPHAGAVMWGDAFALQGAGGCINPAMLVSFNPQPEPADRWRLRLWIKADPGPVG